MKNIILSIFISLLASIAFSQENYKKINNKAEYTHQSPHAVKSYEAIKGKTPKNIILMISDGMGPGHFYAALTANRGLLNILSMKHMGLLKTHSIKNYVTDSAAGGTAISCGKKTYNGAIGVDKDSVPIKSILEHAEAIGKATGLVSTSSLTHATPASFIAHRKSRLFYEAIAKDYLNTEVDVMIGGGYKHFAHRKDGRNLIKSLEDNGYITSRDLATVSHITKGKLAVFTANEHNEKYPERGDMLPLAAEKAIEILHNNSDKGFFLMIEGSQIDWGGHQNDISYVIQDMLDFDRAVGKALEFASKNKETLVIVTADHETGGLTIIDGNEKTGYVKADFSTGHHTGIGVPVFAYGPGASAFMGVYENTAIFYKMAQFWGID